MVPGSPVDCLVQKTGLHRGQMNGLGFRWISAGDLAE